jgi:hypothetical protein
MPLPFLRMVFSLDALDVLGALISWLAKTALDIYLIQLRGITLTQVI